MKPNRIAAALLLLAASAPALAEIDQLQTLTQQEFRSMSEDLGAALSYKPLTPAEPLGLFGFDIGVAATGTRLKHPELFERASGNPDFPSTVVVPSVRASLGLPFSFDASVLYSSVPKTGMSLWGGALSWAVISGDTAWPALGVRASFTRLFGVDQLDFDTAGLDASISKGFGPFTPYIGGGKVWSASTPHSSTGLTRESFSQTKVFGGIGVKVLLLNFVVEADRTGPVNSYGAKLGLRF
ncbi:MAG TPA: hypothetical protein VN675_16200 [Burkholderiales bacterium]|nr:hypothetical protein [Burkholderiales bacterium]